MAPTASVTAPRRIGVLVMAYGTPAGLDDLEAYYTHIRRGRPPAPEQLDELRGRYEAIGGVSPLRERTEAQRAAIQTALDDLAPEGTVFMSALGQKHAAPFLEDAVDVVAAGVPVDAVVGLVLAPHYSKGSVGEYHARARAACEERGVPYAGIDSWADEPAWLDYLTTAVTDARETLPAAHHLVFTAHSLPERVLAGDPYPDELHASALAVTRRLGLPRYGAWGMAWQSAGRTPEPWRGPDILDVMRELAATGRSDGILVCAQGFTSDHLEVLYDLDIEAARLADELGLAFARTRSLNADATVMAALAARIDAAATVATSTPSAPSTTAASDPWVRKPTHDVVVRTQRTGGVGRVVVVGGGIAGLTAAYTVLRDAPGTAVTVLDAADRLGGKLQSRSLGAAGLDLGADAFLARVPQAVGLCRELGLDDDLVSPASGSAFLWLDGELRRLPEGLLLGVPTDVDALEDAGLLTDEGLARLREETDLPEERLIDGDASVGEVVRARLGDEAFERLVAPLLGGVHAGDADLLSIDAGAAQLGAALRAEGSLLRGAAAMRAASAPAGADGAAARPPVFHGLRGGMAQLIEALEKAVLDGGGEIRRSTGAVSLEAAWLPGRTRPLYTVGTDDRHGVARLEADAVVLATPAPAAATLLAPLAPTVAAELASVGYASVVLVTMVLPRAAIDHPLDGSGFLTIPARPTHGDAEPGADDLLLTACSFSSSKWAHLHGVADRDGTERVILRVSAGRAGDERALALDDDELVARLFADLRRTIGLSPELDPRHDDVEIDVTRWIDALPQFRAGHLERVAASDAALAAAHPGLAVVGASRTGLGVPACIVRAQAEVARLLGSAPAPPADDEPGPVLVVLHGYDDDPATLDPLIAALDPRGTATVHRPVGPARGPDGAPRWFDDPTSGDDGPDHASVHAAITAVHDAVRRAGDGDPSRVVLAGFSQGAAVALAAAMHPDADRPLGGLVLVAPFLLDPDLTPLDPTAPPLGPGGIVLVVAGTDDEHVPLPMARSVARWLDRHGFANRLVEQEGVGHDLAALAPATAGLVFTAPTGPAAQP